MFEQDPSKPRFTGIPTFYKAPVEQAPHAADIGIVGIPYDGGTTNRPGARHGPRTVREFSTMIAQESPETGFRPFHRKRVRDFLDVVPNVVYSGAPISRVESGTTLDVRPIVNTETMTIRLEIRPLSHGAVSTLGGTTTIQSNPVTIQMPILAPGNQRTTVTVPDGGTLLLGGIKNLSDDGQGGVPLLSRLPYVNRLFKNTSTMATSDTLLIMVTPRIIIQEE